MKKYVILLCVAVAAISLCATVFANEYRLVEEVCGSDSTKYYYDSSGRMTEAISFNDASLYQTEQFRYGKDGFLTEKIISDPSGWFTLYFHYDSNGTQIELENPGMGGDVFTLNPEEAVVKEETDTEGRTIRFTKTYNDLSDGSPRIDTYYYSYDADGRITRFQSTGRTDIFDYNADGSFVRVSINKYDNTSAIREEYNSQGFLIKSVDQYGNISEYYYSKGKLTHKTITYPGGDNFPEAKENYFFNYSYDKNGNVSVQLKLDDSNNIISTTEFYYEK